MLRVIFQPALPMRGVTSPSSDDRATVSFQPALPMRGVTMTKLTRGFTFLFQPALPMRGVTAGDDGRCVTGHISTRTPHAGSDGGGYFVGRRRTYFNPHSPCGE